MKSFRARILATSLLTGVSLLGSPAAAQQADAQIGTAVAPVDAAAASAPQKTEEIVITGSRIPQPNLTSAAPIATVTNQEIKLTGAVRIEDVVAQLPSAAAPQGASMPNPSTGTAELDLRYLGAQRTLTLVNGRRMTPGDPNQGSSGAGDVNLIPASLVKRVEVLTGGASSVYGADAVAGVVNFIMDTEFDGIRVDGQISGYQHNNNCPSIGSGRTVCDELDRQTNTLHRANYGYPKGSAWDGKAIDATVSFGAGFDDKRGHVVGYFGYRKQDEVMQSQRDYSACTLNVAPAPNNAACGGSLTSAEGNFFVFHGTGSTFYTRGPNSTLAPGRTSYNYAPLNHWIKPDERYTAGLFAHYDVNETLKPYLEFMYMDDKQVAQIAPSGNFGNTFTINCDNPFMSAQARSVVCAPENLVNGFLGLYPLTAITNPGGTPLTFRDAQGNPYQQGFFQVFRRNVEGGPRQAHFEHSSFRGVIGTRGELSNVFSYDAYYQFGKTDYSQVFKNEFSQARLVRANNAVLDTRPGSPTFGQPVCRSVLDGSDLACAPYNYFGAPSQAALDYANVYGVIAGQTSEQIANVNLTGELGQLGVISPWATQGIGINVGWEFRREALKLTPDQSFIQGDLTGQGAPTLPIDGTFHVNELFAETQIPVVEGGFVHELSFGAGYRKSWYKTGAGRSYDTDTFKLSAEFAPIRDIRFRASLNRAARAPNIFELFTTPHIALDGSTDPCAGQVITATDYACIAQGLRIGQLTPLNPAEQYNGMLGGNADLRPEIATTKTVGIVLQPRVLPRFALTVDYWNIGLKGSIQGFGADTILSDCDAKTTATSVAPSCALIHRDAGGSLWLVPPGPGAGYVVDVPTNSGHIQTDGVDFNMSYSHRLRNIGTLSFGFLGTYLRHYKVNNSIAPEYDCAGYYGSTCSGAAVASASAMPKWRHKLRATLDMPFGLGVSLNWRQVGAVKLETNSSDQALHGSSNQLGSHVKAQNYLDFAANYSFGDALTLRAGVNNLLDRNPPIIPTGNGSCPSSACAGNTYPGAWDYMGRFLYAGLTVNFKHRKAPAAEAPLPALPPAPAPATQTCPDGAVIPVSGVCPAAPAASPPPPPPAAWPNGERGS